MSEQSASAKSPALFARKGSARPAGTLIHYERAVALRDAKRAQDGEGDPEAGGKTSADRENSADRIGPGTRGDKPTRTRAKKAKGGKPDQGTDPAGSLLAIPFRRLDQNARGISAENRKSEPSGVDAPPRVPLKKRAAKPLSPAVAKVPAEKLPTASGSSAPATPTAPAAKESAAAPTRPMPAVATPSGAGRESWAAAGLGLLAMTGVVLGLWYTMSDSRRVEEAGRAPAEPVPTAAAPAAPASDDALAAGEADRDDPSAPTVQEHSASTMAPTFDLIRIEPDGQAVIAGRAAPETELILLDNGQPIGTVTADWSGEWAFIPDKPLPAGDHKFSLVVSTPQGTVTVPAPAADTGDGELEGAIDGLKGRARQDRRSSLEQPPAGQGAASAVPSQPDVARRDSGYDVQLSSTTTRKGAEQELTKLQRSFPTLLGDKVLFVQEAKIDESDTRFRVRTGPFAELDPARQLCAEFRSLKQDCLVIER